MATRAKLTNPWLKNTTKSPVIGFKVLKNSIYTNLSNLKDTTIAGERKSILNKIHPTTGGRRSFRPAKRLTGPLETTCQTNPSIPGFPAPNLNLK